MLRYSLLMLIGLTLSNCGEKNEKLSKDTEAGADVEIVLYRHNDEIGDSISGKMIIQGGEEFVDYLYYPLNPDHETYVQSVRLFPNTDSIILFNSDTAHFVASKGFTVDNKMYIVKKYHWDLPNSDDEESLVFISSGLGMIGYRNYPWGLYGTVYNTKTNIEEVLLSDTTGFFRVNHR